MSALLFVLSFAFVQVQSLAPRIFSSRTYFGAEEAEGFSGVLITEEEFECRFNGLIGSVVGWNDWDTAAVIPGITVQASHTEANETWEAVSVPGSGTPTGFRFTVRPVAGPEGLPPTFSLDIMGHAGMACKAGPALAGVCEPNALNGNTLVVNVAHALTYSIEWQNVGLNEMTAVLTLSHNAYSNIDNYLTVNGAATMWSWERQFMAVEENVWLFQTQMAETGNELCVVTEEIHDRYGYSLPYSDVSCFTVPEQLCDSWSEWSDTCIYSCIPLQKDMKFNVETRTRKSAAFPNCQIPDETRECGYEDDAVPCEVQIFNGETGDECANACQSGRQPSGCECGGDCEEQRNCCQSYYAQCIGEEEATTNPVYFYDYAPCWTPSTCTQLSPSPPETFACSIDFNSADGFCDSRPYKYGCYCGFNTQGGFTCGDVGGTDLCCSGSDSQVTNCDEA